MIAKKKTKPITVVMPPGITSVTELMLEVASEFVGWSAVSTVTAIRK